MLVHILAFHEGYWQENHWKYCFLIIGYLVFVEKGGSWLASSYAVLDMNDRVASKV